MWTRRNSRIWRDKESEVSGVDSHQVEFFMRVDLFLGY